jgi:hypothetical protein
MIGRGWRTWLAAGSLWMASLAPAHAGIITYTFESLGDTEAVGTTQAGLIVTNGMALTAGFSLNEFAFPPSSGVTAVVDDGGPISITFSGPVRSVFGRFTYVDFGLRLDAYDSADTLLGSVSSLYLTNTADGSGDPGSSPNEAIGFTAADFTIARVVLTGGADGFSFLLDDLALDVPDGRVPEPAGGLLILLGLAGLMAARWRGPAR